MESVTITTILAIIGLILMSIRFIMPGLWQSKGDDLIINAIGAFIGFLGGYIIYILQTASTDKGDKQQELKRHKEHLRYFAGVMADVVRYARNQADELDKIGEAIKAEPSTIHQLAFIASGSVDRLNRADNEAAFHAYNTLLATDAQHEANYKAILAQTDLLTDQLAGVKQAFVHYRDNIYDRQLRLKALIQNIANETAYLLRDVRKGGQAAAFKKYAPAAPEELNNIMLSYLRLNALAVTFERYFDEFIEPLKRWLRDNEDYILLEGEVQQRTSDLVRLAEDSSVPLTALRANALEFISAFNSQNLLIPSANLEEMLKEINKVAQ